MNLKGYYFFQKFIREKNIWSHTFGVKPFEPNLSSQTFLAYNQVGEYNKGDWRWP